MRPAISESADPSSQNAPARQEHVPVYSCNLLRTLECGPVQLRSLFGTDDEGAVFFLVSRGLAERRGPELAITETGRQIGRLAG